MVFYGIQFLQVETLPAHSAIVKKYTCDFFIELTPGLTLSLPSSQFKFS